LNIAMVLEMAVDGLGDRVAVGGPQDGLAFSGLLARARALAGRLDIRRARMLAWSGPMGEAVPIALFGAAWAGASYAPINYRLPPEVRRNLIDRLGSALLIEDASDALLTDGDGPRSYVGDPARAAVVLFTSGTTSAPKAALLSHDNLLSYLFNTLEYGSADEDEAAIVAAPPFHVAGVAAVLSNTYLGRRMIPLPQFSAEAWLRNARSGRATHAFVVPTMLARIVAVMEREGATVPSLRHLAYGGSRMPLPVLERALELFPDVDFVNAYGLTETSSTVAILGPDDHREAHASDDPGVRGRLASVGQPVPGIEVRVVDDEIQIRGAQVGGGYADGSGLADGEWLATGDRGRIDEAGYVYVAGRLDDLIIRGGENISPAEIEDALLGHPDIESVAVVGLPDEEWGEQIAAMVTLRSGAAAPTDELYAWTKDRLGSLKAPARIAVRGELPVTPSGKVLRRQVKADLLAD
jgi:acyl-CoA synthetase (AMP-forming)/AMP-acid ligase II